MARAEFSPDGRQLADLLRALWDALSVENVLEQWSLAAPGAFHQTVLEQMNSWLDNLALGFGGKRLPPRDWLPILEAGLAHLTVGIIPPVLDEVLVGAVDRARSPDLKLTLVLGAYEGVFPAAPVSPEILTSDDRAELDLALGPDLREQISRERFFGYLACTRPRERLAVTFSRADADGKPLNPSPFVGHLRRLFPALPVESFTEEIALPDAEHAMELALRIPDGAVAGPAWQSLLALPAMASFQRLLGELREAGPRENLAPDLAQRLYGPVLRTSVSRLEEFASCPFRFFVRSGLRAEERKIFELDARERGSFQHDVLKQFHESVLAEHRRWRDLTPEEGRRRIQAIAAEMMERYHGGVLSETARSRFAARALAESLQEFVAVTLGWLREQYQFDPVASELPFGEKDSPETAWQIPLNHGRTLALRGRIDRVDLFQQPNGDSLAVVVDYKSSAKRLDAILIEHGVQLQLLAYLNVLQHWAHPETPFGSRKLNPVGVFYVNLRGQPENGTRAEVLARSEQARRAAYRHTGRFDADVLPQLDRVRARDQFHYRLTDSGKLHAGSAEALPRAAFHQLLDRVETRLREFGDAIFSGVADVNPYRKGKQTPCEFCD
ncbi:MAG TPA: PD-(D/E)XK nuclease family protein, partial [Verrucomicrobiae bacterium]|nr:PD-(D/E)XK nuclease family protein [Verrucomicrobiae bacterium]